MDTSSAEFEELVRTRPYDEVADLAGVSVGTVYYHAQRLGCDVAPTGRRRGRPPLLPWGRADVQERLGRLSTEEFRVWARATFPELEEGQPPASSVRRMRAAQNNSKKA